MIKIKTTQLILILIVFLAVALRFYKLESIPAGFHQDEVSQAYNAFALGTTGHDRYGQYFPILFRSFGSYQPPVYTYLSPIPILLLGNTIFAARFLSALAGVIIVILTYLIVVELTEKKYKYTLGTIAALVICISPWAIQFSRRVVEANLGLVIFLTAVYLFIRSLKLPKFFPLAALVMGISTQAYYSERIISILFIPIFLIVFSKIYLKYKTQVFLGLILFGMTQLPHLWILTTGAYARRFTQVSYFGNDPQHMPRIIYLALEFIKHFLIYISPSNLFADTGRALSRVSPDLGVFYSWLFLPFIVGIINFLKQTNNFFKVIAILAPISLIPASLTGDLFYPLRILEFLWVVSIIVSCGIYVLLNSFKFKRIGLFILGVLTIYSLVAFYISHAVLFKYEINSEYMGQSYIELNQNLKRYNDKKIIIDSTRDFAIGLRIAYFRAFDANKLANILRPQLASDYYSSQVAVKEVYKIDNIEVRPFIWEVDPCLENTILIGDTLAISENQALEHKLTSVFKVKAPDNRVVLQAYSTSPGLNCQ